MLPPLFSSQSLSSWSVVAGSNKYDEDSIQAGIEGVYTMVGTAHTCVYKPGMVKQPTNKKFVRGDPEWVSVFFKYMSQMLADGRFTGHPVEVINGGLWRGSEGLRRSRAGHSRGVKYAYKAGEVDREIFGALYRDPPCLIYAEPEKPSVLPYPFPPYIVESQTNQIIFS